MGLSQQECENYLVLKSAAAMLGPGWPCERSRPLRSARLGIDRLMAGEAPAAHPESRDLINSPNNPRLDGFVGWGASIGRAASPGEVCSASGTWVGISSA